MAAAQQLPDPSELSDEQREAIETLLAEYAPGADATVRSSECRGNPLLAIELARSQKGTEGGSSLQELIRERLASLDLDGADVLRWAALLAPRIDSASLSRVTDLDSSRVGEILESAERMALHARDSV